MIFGMAFSQSDADRNYLKQANEESQFLHDHHNRVESYDKNKTFNPLIWALNLYKSLVAEQLSTGCVYKITCSDFMRMAIAEYNFVKGFFLGLDRLTRCNSISLNDIPEFKFDKENRLIYDPPKAYRMDDPGKNRDKKK